MMASRKRDKGCSVTMEDAALDSIAQRAELILQEKKKEREKARKMRMEELERQQKEENEHLDKQYELFQKVGSTPGASARRNLQPAPASRGSSVESDSESKDIKVAYSELEEKYRRAMVGNSQLDNEKQAVAHLVDVLKDKLEDSEEKCYELQREAQDKHKRLGEARHLNKSLVTDIERLKILLTCRDELMRQYNLQVVEDESNADSKKGTPLVNGTTSDSGNARPVIIGTATRQASDECASDSPIVAAVLSTETADMLKLAAPGTFDDKVKGFILENTKLKAEIANVRKQMEEERESRRPRAGSAAPSPTAGADAQANGVGIPTALLASGSVTDELLVEQQRESARQMAEYKAKIQKADSDLASLESSVLRLEVQVRRFKEMAEEAERTEDELKADKRKLQKQLKEAQLQIEELETQKQHLQNRLDKIRQARKEVLGN